MKNWLLLKKFQLKLEEFDSSETVLLTLLQNWNYTDLISSKLSCTLFPLKHLYFQNCSNFFIFLQHVCALFCLAFINTCCYDHLFFFLYDPLLSVLRLNLMPQDLLIFCIDETL